MTMSDALTESEQALAFLGDFVELSGIGATRAGGVDRQAGTKGDGDARDWLRGWLSQRGFQTVVDPIGNLFGLLTFDEGAPYILAGSHLDSQPTAGRLDGAYGVLAAAHAAERVRQDVVTGAVAPQANLAVVDWFNEEGSRFAPSIMGSGVYSGKLDLRTCLSTRDELGVTVEEALEGIRYLGGDVPPRAAAYAEIHVEQGRTLESAGIDIGLVTSNWAVCKFEVIIEGEQAHTGTADFRDRKDALLGAARVILMVNEIAITQPSTEFLASVGRAVIYPNVPGVVASRVTLFLDIRAANEGLLKEMLGLLRRRILEVAEAGSAAVVLPTTVVRPSIRFPEPGVRLAAEAAESTGLSYCRILTRAGHDAIYMNDIVPTVMTFIPSKNGASHGEKEDTADSDLVNGVNFFSSVLRMLVSRGPEALKEA